MADYSMLGGLMPAGSLVDGDAAAWRPVVAYLAEVWLANYAAATDDVVTVGGAQFSYMFDTAAERLLAAWGISQGKHEGERDKSRMRGHPLSAGPLYHRGHAIPHSLGGPTDINLVPQRGSVNVGPFRQLEKDAVATPGALYFTYWKYPRTPPGAKFPSQVPSGVDQGLLIPGQAPRVIPHGN
jgi:hypothetical protein